MKILVCDRCGFELSNKDEIVQALEGSDAWKTATRTRGEEPRGVYPCKHYIRCQGEMRLVEKKNKGFWRK